MSSKCLDCMNLRTKVVDESGYLAFINEMQYQGSIRAAKWLNKKGKVRLVWCRVDNLPKRYYINSLELSIGRIERIKSRNCKIIE
jgi:hypothetical protein